MIDFPTSPILGQAFVYGTRTWTWDGSGWQRQVNAGQLASVFINPGTEIQLTLESLPILVSADWYQLTYI